MNKEQPKMYGLNEALQMLVAGKTMQLVDNGKGLMLPGIVVAPNYQEVAMLASRHMPANMPILKAMAPLMNIVQTPDGAIVRFYTVSAFEQGSTWIEVETEAEVSDIEQETDEDAEEPTGKTIPFRIVKSKMPEA